MSFFKQQGGLFTALPVVGYLNNSCCNSLSSGFEISILNLSATRLIILFREHSSPYGFPA